MSWIQSIRYRVLLDGDRVGRGGDAAFEDHGGRDHHALVTPVAPAIFGQRGKHEQFPQRQTEQRQGSVMQNSLVGEIAGHRLYRGAIGSDRGDAVVPQPRGQLARRFDPDRYNAREGGQARFVFLRRALVGFHPSCADQQDRAGLERGALELQRAFQFVGIATHLHADTAEARGPGPGGRRPRQ